MKFFYIDVSINLWFVDTFSQKLSLYGFNVIPTDTSIQTHYNSVRVFLILCLLHPGGNFQQMADLHSFDNQKEQYTE